VIPAGGKTISSTVIPAGASIVNEIVFPPSTDLKQTGSEQPLAVFERAFDVGVRLGVASTVAPGDVIVPLHLRYQACDATVCYAPATADAQWSLHVVPAGATVGAVEHRELFGGIAFGHGEAPAVVHPVVAPPVSARPIRGDGLKALEGFSLLATTGASTRTTPFSPAGRVWIRMRGVV
jgi:hypothetical protein